MASNTEIAGSKEDAGASKGPFSFLPKFKIELPFLKPGPKPEIVAGEEVKGGTVIVANEGQEDRVNKPDVVKFTERRPVAPAPLVVEAEESSAKTSNPVILWQVYALGGFLVLRWIWARWQERTKKGSSDNKNDEPSDVE